eukprot:TRINITY_DN7638_c0_g1_i3.p2 TRINITY_DN7638_c0_g1~~TRINITY_DN7638_c0_g1_i3.p2  ORF type:complete len:115 (+),score=17.96 TRINITY_DN7638_c0_g1_i3:54-347(+)
MAMTRCVSTAAARLRGGTLRASRAWHSTTSGGGMNETEYRTGTASSALRSEMQKSEKGKYFEDVCVVCGGGHVRCSGVPGSSLTAVCVLFFGFCLMP